MAVRTETAPLAFSNVSTNPVSEKFKSFEFEISKTWEWQEIERRACFLICHLDALGYSCINV